MQTSSSLLFPPLGIPLLYPRYLHRHHVFINSFPTSFTLAQLFTALHLQSIYFAQRHQRFGDEFLFIVVDR